MKNDFRTFREKSRTIDETDRAQFKEWARNDFAFDDDDDSPHRGWNSAHAQKVMLKIIKHELTERERQILRMHYIQGIRVTDIALELGIQKSSVSRTLSRAQEKIAKFMKYTFM